MEFINVGYATVILMYISNLQMYNRAFFLFCCFHIGTFLQSYIEYGK